MAKKLYFKWAAMGSGKSRDLIRAVYNYRERGMEVLVYKPDMDTRDGMDKCTVKSRTGEEIDATWLPKDESIFSQIVGDLINTEFKVKAIFIDEAQFLNEGQVDELQKICYNFNIAIMCYGLLVDFQRHLFPGSKRLIEIADRWEELVGICHCGSRTRQNARVVNGVHVLHGDVIQIGGNESYVPVCNRCFLEGRVD